MKQSPLENIVHASIALLSSALDENAVMRCVCVCVCVCMCVCACACVYGILEVVELEDEIGGPWGRDWIYLFAHTPPQEFGDRKSIANRIQRQECEG